MDENISCGFSATSSVQDGMKKVLPTQILDPSKCETNVTIGVFFDGTNNNRDESYDSKGHSNIARLSDSYPRNEDAGFFRVYVPGVGTPFDRINDDGESVKGGAFGVGCEQRVLFGLLSMFDSIHRRVYKAENFFSGRQIALLCESGKPSGEEAKKEIAKLNVSSGLRECNKEDRINFLKTQAAALQKKITRPGNVVVKEVYVDVFGFSRGAAQARVFLTWFSELLEGGKFAGLTVELRFLGIFDTVVSFGVLDGLLGGAANYTAPHIGWAKAENLKVPSAVKNCVHLIAMHELRKNFPLDYLRRYSTLPSNHIEAAYPGSHSDVGGGYAPGELGISFGKNPMEGDSLKLSQIPLNHMFDYARAAGVPLDKRLALSAGYDPFAVSAVLTKAFNEFLRESGTASRPLREWMQPYLNWRWQIRVNYGASLHMTRATAEDRSLLKASNQKLIRDANLLLGCGNLKQAEKHVKSIVESSRKSAYDMTHAQISIEIPQFDSEAVKVVHDAKAAAPVSASLAYFFDNFIHDSLAGFRKDLVEQTGYWRYRKAFRGDDRPIFAANDENKVDMA